ncbi:TPA: hypothetical protein EYO12_02815 [Candidatus Saccharibacteria bacterium]|nr:hypothetical protein [Candidatus Saccharibacteria bacterium]HIO88029.1 hypothetical protein [Candidatus Saccharibacteria bacterium]
MADDKVQKLENSSPGGLKGLIGLILLGIFVFIIYFAFVSSNELPAEESLTRSQAEIAAIAEFKELTTEETTATIETSEEQTWPDGCLGLPDVDQICTQALVEGYRITVVSDEHTAVFRTNLTGSNIALESFDEAN